MEFVKILKNKKFIVAVILLLLFNCVSFYITQQNNIEDFGLDIRVYSEQFRKNADIFEFPSAKEELQEKNAEFQILKSFAEAEQMKAENPQEYEFYAEEEALLISENPELYKEYQSGKYSYDEISATAEFYAHFASLAEYQSGYGDYISGVIENGKELSGKSLFSDKDSFSYKSIQKSITDFSKNKGIELSLINDLPVSYVLNYHTGDLILIMLCVFLSISFVPEKNAALLINLCKNGRMMLKIKQIPILFLFSLFGSLVIFVSQMLISLKIYNAPIDLTAPIQSSDIFKDCILHMDFMQFFLMSIVFKAATATTIALLIWLLISLIGNILFVSATAGIFAAAEILLYKNISEQSTLSFFKTFNLFSLFDYKITTEYNLISFFGIPIRAELLIWIIVLSVMLLLSAVVVLGAKRNYPMRTPSKLFSFFGAIFKKLSIACSKIQSIVYAGRFETYKIMHIGKGFFVIAVFILILAFSFNTNQLVFSPTESFLNDYYDEYGGKLNSAVYDSISEMQAQAQTVQAEFEEKAEQYSKGMISFEEYELARAKNAAYDTQRQAAAVLLEQVNRIEPLKEKGITPVLINETGYNALFSPQSNQTEILLLLCAVSIMFSGVFPIEKSSNMLCINHCAKNGRKRLWGKKIIAVVPKVFVLTAISYFFYAFQIAYLYRLDFLSADIQNLECLQNVDLSISVFQYLLLNFAFEFIFVLAASLIVSALSEFTAQFAVIIISAGIFVLPGALSSAGISALSSISASRLFNFNSVVIHDGMNIKSFALHIVLAAAAVLLLYLSERKWCSTREQVKI